MSDDRPPPQFCEQHREIMARQRDAPVGRREARPREMHEDGAAFAPHARPVVITEHQHQIVEMVVALQSFGASPRWQGDQPVVVAVGGIVAPAVVIADGAHRQSGAGPGDAVGPIKYLAHCEAAERRRAVAFALQGVDAGAAERRGPDAMPKRDPRVASIPRRAPDQDRLGSLNPHDNEPFSARASLAICLSKGLAPLTTRTMRKQARGRR